MRLSIVIVNYRTWDDLGANLRTLIGGAAPADNDYEIVVVDNASGDGRAAGFRADFPELRLVEADGNFGFAYGCNLGASVATGDSLLFMNPDLKATPDAVRTLLAEREAHGEVAILSARQVDARGRVQKSFDAFPGPLSSIKWVRALARKLRPSRYPDARKTREPFVSCDWVSGSLLLIDREDFEALGGWDEDFWLYMEDVDLCRRARDRSMTVACTQAAEFVHSHGAASRADAAIAAVTKSELTVSHHLYASRHFRGAARLLFHTVIFSRTMLPLALAACADLLSLRKAPALALRTEVLGLLCRYYARAARTCDWRSARIRG